MIAAFRRPAAALVVVLLLWPTLVLGQEGRAGVVTTLQGNVVAVRASLPQPVPLKFKDDVFLNDRITTGDQSIARMLLGGKAVVTVRERSTLTITEVPGRSTINLESGKIAVAVAREKMRPGEAIEVRTPNAVAGVRGTVFVVEVSRATAQLGTGLGAPTTRVSTITGTVTVQLLSPTGQILATVIVPANQFAAITGSASPTSGTMTPAQRAAALAGLAAGLQHQAAANADQVKEQVTATTAAVINAILTGTPTPTGETVTFTSSDDSSGTSGSGSGGKGPECVGCPIIKPGGQELGSPMTPTTPTCPPTCGIPSTLSVNSSLPSSFLVSSGGVADAIVQVPATAGALSFAGPLFTVANGSPVNGVNALERPLLSLLSSLTLTTGGLLTISDVMTSLTTSPLIFVDPTTVTLPGELVLVNGTGALITAGTLFSVLNSTVNNTGALFMRVASGGSWTSTSTNPIVLLSGSTLTGGTLLQLDHATADLGTSATVVDMTGGTMTLTGPLVKLNTASTLTAGTLLKMNGGTVMADALGLGDGSVNTANIRGTFLDLSNAATATFRVIGEDSPDNDASVGNFRRSANVPGIKLVNSTLTVTGTSGSGHTLVWMDDDAAHTQAGTALSATNSTLTMKQRLMDLENTSSTATNALVQLAGSTITQNGPERDLIHLAPSGGARTMAAQLLTGASSSTITSSTITGTGNIVAVDGASGLTSGTTSAWIDLTSTKVVTPRHFVSLANSGSLTLAGRVLKADEGGNSALPLNLSNTAFNTAALTANLGIALPESIAVAPNGRTGYVAHDTSTISIVNTDPTSSSFRSVTGTIAVSGGLGGVVVSPDGTRLYVGTAGGLQFFNTSNNTLGGTFALPTQGGALAINAAGTQVYVAHFGNNNVSSVTVGSGLVTTFTVGTQPSAIAFAPNTTRAYVVNEGSNTVSVVNTVTNTVLGTPITVGTSPSGIAITPDGTRAYVTNSGSNSVSVIDLNTNAVVATITGLGTGPGGIAITSDGTRAYVVNAGSNNFSVITTSNNTLVGTFSGLGASPEGIAIASNGFAFVTNRGATTLSEIQTSPGGRFLNLAPGTTLTSNGTDSLYQLSGTTATSGGSFMLVSGALSLKSTLLEALASSALLAGGSLLTVASGGSLTDAAAAVSTDALLKLSGGSVATAGNIINVSGNPFGTATLSLKRPVFSSTSTTVTPFFNFLRIGDGGSVTSTATAPFVQFSGGSYAPSTGGTGPFLRMFSLFNQGVNSLTLAGGLLLASGGATLNASNAVFLDIRDGATLQSTGTVNPFLDFSGASATAGFNFMAIGPGSTSGGGSGTGVAPTATFASRVLRIADTGTALTFSSGGSSSFISIFNGASVTKSGTAPFLDLIGSAAGLVTTNAAGNLFFLGATTSTAAAANQVGNLTLAGSLVKAVNATVTTANDRSLIFIGDGSAITKSPTSDTNALLDFQSSTITTGAALLSLRRSNGTVLPSKLILGAAPLMTATNSTITGLTTGLSSPCCSGVFVGQGASLTSTGTGALLQLTSGSSFTAGSAGVGGGTLFHVSDFCGTTCTDTFNVPTLSLPSTVTLAGGVFSVADSTIGGLFSGIFVTRSTLTAGSATSPLISISNNTTNKTYSFGGSIPAAQGGGTATGHLFGITACVPGTGCSGITSPTVSQGNAAATLGGQLLVSSNTGTGTRNTFNTTADLTTGGADFISITGGASLTATGTAALVTSNNSTYNIGNGTPFAHFFRPTGTGGLSGTTPSTASLTGPLLTSTSDTFRASSAMLEVNSGTATDHPTFTSATTGALMTFTGSTVLLGPAGCLGVAACQTSSTGNGNVAEVNPNTGITLHGPIATVDDTTVHATAWAGDRLLYSHSALGLTTSGNTDPLFSFLGAAAGSAAHTFTGALGDLLGFATTTTDTDPDAPATVLLGTDQPLQHSGILLQATNNAAITSGGPLLKIDTALLQATKPLLSLVNSSVTTTTNGLTPNAFDLVNKAKVTVNVPTDAMVMLNASTLTVTNGAAVSLAGGSFLKVIGDLIRLTGGSTLTIASAPVLNIAGGSSASISGALVNFIGTGNTVNITNTVCGGACATINGIPFFATGGATTPTAANIGANSVKNLTGNTINFSSSSAAAIVLNGTNSKVKVGQ